MNKRALQALQDDYQTHNIKALDGGDFSDVYANRDYVFKIKDDVDYRSYFFQDNTCNKYAPDVVDIRTYTGPVGDGGNNTKRKYIVVEDRVPDLQPKSVLSEHAHMWGNMLREIQNRGRKLHMGTQELKYAYPGDEHEALNKQLQQEDDDEISKRIERHIDKRKVFYGDHARYVDAIRDIQWETPIMCHRDYTLSNALITDNAIYITDWEFADLFYPGIEFTKAIVDMYYNGLGENVEDFVTGYMRPGDTWENFYKEYVGQFVNYYTFNAFPFDRDVDKQTKLALADERDTFLNIFNEQHETIESIIKHVIS